MQTITVPAQQLPKAKRHSVAAETRYRLLDVWVNALSRIDLDRIVAETISSNERVVIGNHNLHSVYLFHHDAGMRKFYDIAKYVHIDGMSLVFVAKLLRQPITRNNRTGYMDWLPSLMEAARRENWRVFYLGSRADVLSSGLTEIRRRWPGIQIAGHHGYFNKSKDHPENQSVLQEIQSFAPHILLVGMGMPIQERWIADSIAEINANVVLHCGAMLDYVAGVIPLPPRWLGRLGLEWLFRLCSEPKRLWRRYLIEPLVLAAYALRRRDGKENNL